jgi:hypothetical protein
LQPHPSRKTNTRPNANLLGQREDGGVVRNAGYPHASSIRSFGLVKIGLTSGERTGSEESVALPFGRLPTNGDVFS